MPLIGSLIRYAFSDGCVFEGLYVDGRRHGHGKFTRPDGSWEEADWNQGCQVPGTCVQCAGPGEVARPGLFNDVIRGARALVRSSRSPKRAEGQG